MEVQKRRETIEIQTPIKQSQELEQIKRNVTYAMLSPAVILNKEERRN
jgi:hypothetical protein